MALSPVKMCRRSWLPISRRMMRLFPRSANKHWSKLFSATHQATQASAGPPPSRFGLPNPPQQLHQPLVHSSFIHQQFTLHSLSTIFGRRRFSFFLSSFTLFTHALFVLFGSPPPYAILVSSTPLCLPTFYDDHTKHRASNMSTPLPTSNWSLC